MGIPKSLLELPSWLKISEGDSQVDNSGLLVYLHMATGTVQVQIHDGDIRRELC